MLYEGSATLTYAYFIEYIFDGLFWRTSEFLLLVTSTRMVIRDVWRQTDAPKAPRRLNSTFLSVILGATIASFVFDILLNVSKFSETEYSSLWYYTQENLVQVIYSPLYAALSFAVLLLAGLKFRQFWEDSVSTCPTTRCVCYQSNHP